MKIEEAIVSSIILSHPEIFVKSDGLIRLLR